LGGFCAGGLVAFEMARRLRAGGDDVANVILIDVPDAPRTLQRVAAYVDRSGALLGIAARHRLRLTGALARIPHHRARFAASSAKLDFVTGRSVRLLSGRRASAGPAATAALAPDAALLAAWTRLTEAYVPLPYDGRLTLLLTRADDRSELSGSGGWSALAPQVELHAIPGTHLTCIAEFVDGTAHVLADALAGQP
jgi:thioesterase domain-containing protein